MWFVFVCGANIVAATQLNVAISYLVCPVCVLIKTAGTGTQRVSKNSGLGEEEVRR